MTNAPTSPSNHPLGDEIVRVGMSRLGEGETPAGSNRGPLPDKALRFCGVDPTQGTRDEHEWCAAKYCLDVHDAFTNLRHADNGPRTVSSGGIYDWAQARGQVIYVPRACRKGRIRPMGGAGLVRPGDAGLIISDLTDTGFKHTVKLVKRLHDNVWLCEAGNEHDTCATSERDLSTMVVIRAYKD